MFNAFQQQRDKKLFRNATHSSPPHPKSKLHRGVKTLASSKEVMILVLEENATATTSCSSKTPVTKTATFVKEIPH